MVSSIPVARPPAQVVTPVWQADKDRLTGLLLIKYLPILAFRGLFGVLVAEVLLLALPLPLLRLMLASG